jgi:predicted dinucleotide-binding enzyme
MNIGVFGTGAVGTTIGTKLISLGHNVKMGSRTANNEKAAAWVNSCGKTASQGTFTDAAGFGEIIFNCTSGVATLEVVKLAGKENFSGKIFIDVSNPLDFSKGFPPTLTVCNADSIGEQIQRELPDAKVVKTLNTTNCKVMVEPSLVPGDHDMFICGNDDAAKEEVKKILNEWFSWKSVIDLGDITNARALEMLLPLWVRLYGVLKTPNFNFKIVK